MTKQNFLLGLAVLCVLATPAFAQMQGSSIYTDAWGSPSYIYGSGVTDPGYNTYNHDSRAVTTMISPKGRISSNDTSYTYGAASSFVALLFDDNDLGEYIIDTSHYDYCPISGAETPLGSTYAQVTTGWVTICYDYYSYNPVTDLCSFQVQGNCPVTRCKGTNMSCTRTKEAGKTCPAKVWIKFRFTETKTDCMCSTICVKGTVDVLDEEFCTCAESIY
jgi:hypothetical protein